MKCILFTMLLSILICFSFAETAVNPVQAYMMEPSSASFQQAVNALSEALAKGTDTNRNKLNMLYIANNESDRLLAELVVDADTLASSMRFTLANVLLAKGNYATAIQMYIGLNKEFPNWSCPWRHKGEALYKSNDFESAEQALHQAIETNKEHYDAYVWMALTLNKLGRYREALDNLEHSMQLSDTEEDSDDVQLSEQNLKELYQELKKKVR